MMRCLLVSLALFASVAAANDWPEAFAREGECAVCAARGANHGNESFVDFRTFGDEHYGFCSDGCADAFDQMPEGYATPVLPRPGPSFTWTTLDGDAVTPDGHAALLVDFWATWCTPCVATMPKLETLADDFAADGLKVVGVSIDEKRKALDAFLKRRPLNYAIVHDGGDDPAWWQFRVPAIPAAFLLDGEGRVVAQWRGSIDADEIRREVASLIGAE